MLIKLKEVDAVQILVLDDSNFMRGLLKKELMALGIRESQIQDVSSGADAVQIINSQTFDLCLLDIVMPGIDGVAVLGELKKVQPNAKVVMCSSHSSADTIQELMGIGINDFLIKPFDRAVFREAILRNLPEGVVG